MRYIDVEDLRLPDGWLDEATVAAGKVATGGDPNDSALVWRKLKAGLAQLLDEKCWFCESPIPRSDNAVDHFRPKNRVIDAARPHSGYRWLAFELDNFRYVCTFCNSRRKDVLNGTDGGKQDRFPLLDENTRVYAPGPVHGETPVLLDPCEFGDWELLGCKHENGHPCPATQDPIERRRAAISIEVYHLDHEPTCKQRHQIAVRLRADVEQAKRLFLKSIGDPEAHMEWRCVARKIRKAIDRKAPYSGEMIFLLRGMRHSDHPWIQKLLDG